MSYNPNVPQASDIPSQSQGDMLTNFQQLNTIFDVDHVPFNDATAADRGKHDQSTYLDLAGDPTTLVNEVAVYSKDSGGNSRLFMRQESNGTVIQLSGANPTIATSGSTFLAGDLILKWGVLATPADGDPVTFGGGAFPNNVFALTMAESRNGTSNTATYFTALTTSGFTYKSSTGANDAVHYMAMGN